MFQAVYSTADTGVVAEVATPATESEARAVALAAGTVSAADANDAAAGALLVVPMPSPPSKGGGTSGRT